MVVSVRLSRPASAEVIAAQITSFEVTAPDGKLVKDELRAGATYQISFTVKVAAGINDKGILKTSLVRPQGADRFWSLTGTYDGINTTTWQPGQPEIRFQAVEGEFQMKLQGAVPTDYISTTLANGDVLHIPRDLTLVELSLASGSKLEYRKLQVIDKSFDTYRTALNRANKLLEDTSADPRYVALVRAVVEKAEAEAKAGYTDRAADLLGVVPDAGNWVGPQRSTGFLWVIIGILAVLALLLGYLFMRSRSENGFVRRQADEQAKRLELLSAKATRTGDTALGNEINKVKSELERLTGR